MKIISVREEPIHLEKMIEYFQRSWKSVWPVIYKDCIGHSIQTKNSLPQWYVLEKDGEFMGCAGLITNDFISRMDLYPWICALFVEDEHRGHEYGSLLIEKAKEDARKAGYESVYLCTDHIGYYEKYGFEYIGQGYHPWKEESRIYRSFV
jgi:N-acetylglutamate synthase-like GNAT family acetyltransferase